MIRFVSIALIMLFSGIGLAADSQKATDLTYQLKCKTQYSPDIRCNMITSAAREAGWNVTTKKNKSQHTLNVELVSNQLSASVHTGCVYDPEDYEEDETPPKIGENKTQKQLGSDRIVGIEMPEDIKKMPEAVQAAFSNLADQFNAYQLIFPKCD